MFIVRRGASSPSSLASRSTCIVAAHTLAAFRAFSMVLPAREQGLQSAVTGMPFSPSARVLPRGMTVLAVPDSEAAVNTLSEAYANFTLEELAAFHRQCVKRVGQTESFYEEALMKGFGSGGAGGAVLPASTGAGATATASVTSAAATSDAATPAPAASTKKVAEKSTFDVKLAAFAPEIKIKLIKELRTVTNLSLGDAKAAIDKCPGLVQQNLGKDDAEKLKKAFEALGASVELL